MDWSCEAIDADIDRLLDNRRGFSKLRLQSINEFLTHAIGETVYPQLCIYVGGSYGRLEASCYSDLDLFLIEDDSREPGALQNIDRIVIMAHVIEASRGL